MQNLASVLEAILFVSEQPVTAEELTHLVHKNQLELGLPPEISVEETEPIVRQALVELNEVYAAREGALELRQIAGGYQIMTKTVYATLVRDSVLLREARKLSKTVLETLAIITYKQPVSKSEIDFIRGVDCGYALTKLLDKQLIEPAGRANTPGRPLIYRTTTQFIEYFGLNTLEDLPKPKEISLEEDAVEAAYRNILKQAQEEEMEHSSQPNDAAKPNALADDHFSETDATKL
jgi:segregation and condensation protein B